MYGILLMGKLSESQIVQQSLNCYNQWKDQWREHAKFHGERFEMKPLDDLNQIGVGKAALLIGNGYSFEKNIETIKQYQENVDIVVCDKTLGHCLENGIIPDFCIVCDANVSYEKYLKPYKDQLEHTTFIGNVCCQIEWATNGNWKDTYFFVNKDSIKSEHEFMALSKCPKTNLLVAGTNVSNCMVIVVTRCDNNGKRNFFGYDKILTIGFDYSWDQKYYSFDHDGGGKINYMRHAYVVNHAGNMVYTSNNLLFSAKWLSDYVKTFGVHLVNCSRDGIFQGMKCTDDLEGQMQYSYRGHDSPLLRKLVKIHEELREKLAINERKIFNIVQDHKIAALSSI
jgi:hypothetical protein